MIILMSQKGLAPILIILLIAIALGGLFIYQNQTKSVSTPPVQTGVQPSPSSTDETKNWKTYTNTKYGYSIKYPSDWEFTDKTEENMASNQLQRAYFNYSGNAELQSNEVSVNVLNLPEHVIQRVKSGGGFGDAGMASEDVDTNIESIEGKEIIKVHRKYKSLVSDDQWKDNGDNYLVYIPLKEGTYLVLTSNIETKDTIDNIVSAFEFTN